MFPAVLAGGAGGVARGIVRAAMMREGISFNKRAPPDGSGGGIYFHIPISGAGCGRTWRANGGTLRRAPALRGGAHARVRALARPMLDPPTRARPRARSWFAPEIAYVGMSQNIGPRASSYSPVVEGGT